MPTAYEKYSHMPQSNNYEIFSVAHSAKSLVKVTCCIPYQGKLKDVIFYGHIKDVAGREAYLDIAQQEVLTRSCRIYPNEFEYFGSSSFDVEFMKPLRPESGPQSGRPW